MLKRFMWLVALALSASVLADGRVPKAKAKSPIAVETHREWNNGKESKVEIGSEEIERRNADAERMRKIYIELIERQFRYDPSPDRKFHEQWAKVSHFLQAVSSFMDAHLLNEEPFLVTYRAIYQEHRRIWDSVDFKTTRLSIGDFPEVNRTFQDMTDAIKRLMLDLAMERWQRENSYALFLIPR